MPNIGRKSRIKRIIILGTGGNCLDICDIINESKKGRCIGFLDDDELKWGKTIYGVKVLGPLSSATKHKNVYFVNGIGSPNNFWKKDKIICKTGLKPKNFISIIHPTANISKSAKIGYGTVIFPNVTIASNVKIGNHVIILSGTVINHDVQIGDYVCIASSVSISGRVKIGKMCYLGSNSSIREDVNIGDFSLIGMGSVVLRDVQSNNIVAGNPAKFLRYVR